MSTPESTPESTPAQGTGEAALPPTARGSAPGGRIRLALVFGGRSSEHAVSCATAASVLRAIDRDRYEVVPIGIARDGSWVLAADDPGPLELTSNQTPQVEPSAGAVVVPMGQAARTMAVLEPGEPPRALGQVDVVFPLLHGPFGEDGTLQGLFELADTRYVGSGVLASAAMMDKQYMKMVFAGAGLPIGRYAVITDREWLTDPQVAMEPVSALGYPLFVKPARAGSSLGILKVDRPADLAEAIESVRRFDPKVVIEAQIRGRELECGVLQGHGTDRPRASEIGEITVVSGHEFYDFDAKYLDEEQVRLTCPAELPPEVRDRVRELAVRAFEAPACEGLARVDFFYTDTGSVIVNEVNTMPGFTPTSMFPRVWAASGVDYPALIDELVSLAMQRRTGLR